MLKRCPPSAARIASPQQKGAQLRVVELKHIVKGRLTFVVFRVHISSSVKQKRALLCLFSADSNVQGCATRVVLRIRVSPAAEEKGAQLRVSSAYSKVKMCITFVGFGLHISSSVKQKRAQLCVSCADSNVQRRPSEIALLRIHIGPAAEKKGAQLRASPVYSKVERCCAVAHRPVREIMALSIHVGPAVEKKLADLDDFFSNDSNMKRRATPRSGRQVSSSVEQEGTQLCVLSNNGLVKQGGEAFGIHVQHATTSVEQEGTQLCVFLLNSLMESVVVALHDAGIKIQPAETHVSAIYRGEKRRVVDGTTLLAQRGNSTRSQRRHSIDAAPL